MVTVTPSRLTLAAGAQATAEVTVDVQAGAAGLYSGAVTATPATGPAVRTPLGFYKEPERYDLTVKAIGRDGQPAAFADAGVLNVDNGELFADFLVFDEDATVTIRVAPGNYHIMGFVSGAEFESLSMVGDPEVRVTGATTFALDARRAEPVTLGIQGLATDPGFADLGFTRLDAAGTFGFAFSSSAGARGGVRRAVRRADRRAGPGRPVRGRAADAAAAGRRRLRRHRPGPVRPAAVRRRGPRPAQATSCPPPSGPGWPGSTATTATSTTTPSTRTCGSASRPSSSSPGEATSRSPCPGPGPST